MSTADSLKAPSRKHGRITVVIVKNVIINYFGMSTTVNLRALLQNMDKKATTHTQESFKFDEDSCGSHGN